MTYASRFLYRANPNLLGPDILHLQTALHKLGYYNGPLDGNYGPTSEKAVKDFQAAHFLMANGVVGPETWNLLHLRTESPETGLDLDKSAATTSITVDVDKRKLYFSSPALTKTYPVAVGKPSTPTPIGNWTIVQKTMNPGGPFGARWMRLSVPWGGYGIHGTNNPKSIGKAVSHGCIRMYNKDVIEIYDLTPIGTPVHTIGKTPAQRLLMFGMQGEDVKDLQKQLKELRFLKGKADGYFGRLTKRALIDFQRSAGLVPDGTAGPQTMQALQRALDIKLAYYEP